ncbi:response regulator transcription factor [Schaalia hyovaginalis]|uniref:response regulator transcription factor n=1 Tax=Schaalia hyovaginalis TaxID=29316 RepID=UPI002A831C24|nr:response regulator transcription factor [Schaalia hyovaginalis]MDY4491739.1 response regulator transcription factor [Schaalia hyovaginalis]
MNAAGTGSGAGAGPIRIVVVDDQTMVRGALATLLSLEPDIEACGQAGNGAEALSLLTSLVPSAPGGAAAPVDVVLLDVEMPVMDGITACAAIRSKFPKVRVLMLTTFGRPGYVQRSLDAGATGFVVKDAPSAQLADAVRRVASGLKVLDPTLALETLERGACPLTDREVEVLRAVAGGGTIADIASELGLSQGTVRNHVSSAMLKTSARTRAEAVRIATENGWL